MQRAFALGADYLATGHYARTKRLPTGEYLLRQSVDRQKDQSYVLHVLTQQDLAHVLFPVGDYTKEQVRALATRFNLPWHRNRKAWISVFWATMITGAS